MTDHTMSFTAQALDEAALAQLFTEARTHAAFAPTPVADHTLRRLYQLASLGPTSQNCQPARFVFVATEAGRERLLPHVAAGNVPKVQSAPVTVIVARANFESKPAHARETAVRNASLTGAYLLMAARALGLACGPMSGFDAAGVNRTFFPDGRWEVDFLINLGWPAGPAPRARGPRLAFEQACVLA